MLQTSIQALLHLISNALPLQAPKSGNQLDLIYSRYILVQPLHISDHFFITFTLHFATRVPPTHLPATFRLNLPFLLSHLSSVVSSSLPSHAHFSSGCECSYGHFMLYFNLLSRQYLSSSSPGQHELLLLTPGYPMFFVSIAPNAGQQRQNGANQKICQTWVSISLCFHLSLLKSTLPKHHISTTRSTALQTHVISSEHLIISSVPLHHLPPLL